MKTNYIWLLAILFIGFTACESDDDSLADPFINDPVTISNPPNYTSGTADFSTFMSIGNSLTAGFADGALYLEGQDKSFPNILAGQFTLAGGGSFRQPLVDDNLGGMLLGGMQVRPNRLFFDTLNQAPTPISGTPTTEISNVMPGPYNNMGVPGAKSFHLLANGYGNVAGVAGGLANPYFARMASTSNASMLEDALAMNATFFSLWIGNNDILSYATSGGSGVDHNETGNLDPSTYAGNDITNVLAFGSVYNGLLQGFTANGAEGIVTNIPSVTDAPFFTTVPYNPVPLDAATAGALNQAFITYNGGLATLQGLGAISAEEVAQRTINFVAGQNAVTIVDEDLTDLSGFGLPSYRHATENDLIILPSSSFIGTTVGGNPQLINGVSVPLADNWVLTPQEQTTIANATAAFNATIENLATQYDLAFFDVNAFFNEVLTTGVSVGNGDALITGDYVTGGAFSLDGIHPSPRGNAVIANEMIDLINAKHGSNLPKVNAIDYTGLYIN